MGAVGGLGFDSCKMAWEKIRGKKPPKHVECKKGHPMDKVDKTWAHHCDICGVAGITRQCKEGCNYDMCEKCYKESKKKVKAKWKEWVEKHPEDKKKGKDEDDDEEEKKSEKGEKSETETPSKAASEADPSEEDKKSGKSEDEKEAEGKDKKAED